MTVNAAVGRRVDAAAPSVDSEIMWLLHRAAQRMRTALNERAEEHGVQLRDHIVLSALHKTPDLTQIELGTALALDKTTLTGQLDRLERAGLVERRPDPRDRRVRIPRITESGEAVRARLAVETDQIESAALTRFDADEIALFRRMLIAVIGERNDPGSCL